MKKPVFSYRLDETVIKDAQFAGIDIPRFIEVSLQQALKINKCQMCGAKQKGKK